MDNSEKPRLVSSLIDPEMFKELRCRLYLLNNTSGLQYLDHQKISMSEFGEKFCVLNIPPGACSESHMLTLCIVPDEGKSEKVLSISNDGIPGSITILGKASNVEKRADGALSITLDFTQFIEREWETFKDKYNKRQKLASDMIDNLKS